MKTIEGSLQSPEVITGVDQSTIPSAAVTTISEVTSSRVITMVDGEDVAVDDTGRSIDEHINPQTGTPGHPRVLASGVFFWG